jgi:ATP-dependent protease Clp ATPase subunit
MADLRCSVCDKSQPDVQEIIAGNKGVAICNEWVEACNDILADSSVRQTSSPDDDRYEVADDPAMVRLKCPVCAHHFRIAKGFTRG